MPNPYYDVTVISRSGGRSAVATAAYDTGSKLSSAVASAAYRSGEVLHDEQVNKTFDYRRKENIVHTEIVTPADAPGWATDRQRLWNEVEAAEKRKDAQLARSIIAALPRELSDDENISLVRAYVREHFVTRGMIADIAIHDKDASDGGRNPHVHIMLTMRDVNAAGFGRKNREWNGLHLVGEWRNAWEQVTNRYLESAGSDERVSLQSYEAQGIDRIPQQHMGYEAAALERHGRETRVGDRNREIRQGNAARDAARGYEMPQAAFADYSREEIERYYAKQWQEETRLYEPDTGTLEAIREKEAAARKPPARTWERYAAAHIRKTTWYGSHESKTIYAWRRVTDRLTPLEAEARQSQAVGQSVASQFYSGIRNTVERVARITNLMSEKVKAYGQTIIDRYAGVAEQVRDWGRGRERGYER